MCTFCHVGTPSKLYKQTSPNWIPLLKLGWDAETPNLERYYCAEQRKRRKLDNDAEIVEEPTEIVEEEIDLNSECVNMVDVACERQLLMDVIDKAGEIYALQGEIRSSVERRKILFGN